MNLRNDFVAAHLGVGECFGFVAAIFRLRGNKILSPMWAATIKQSTKL
jgi:hypothetical protein